MFTGGPCEEFVSKHLVVLDSGFFVALMVRKDRYHAVAAQLLNENTGRLLVTTLVLSETYSHLLHTFGEDAARDFRGLYSNLNVLQIELVDTRSLTKAEALLDRFRGVKLTMVDAVNLAVVQEKKVGTVWATDGHMGLSGALLPMLERESRAR
jgi:predicted nucleic acid-binding protein